MKRKALYLAVFAAGVVAGLVAMPLYELGADKRRLKHWFGR
jgi:hypothetical protein